MTNLFTSSTNTDSVDFWVWIHSQNSHVRHNISFTGRFFSGGLIPDPKNSNLMFIPNPDFEGFITPFQSGITHQYMAEYNLEKGREFYNFTNYPSRLNAIYLFDSEEEAHKYKARHLKHVDGRILKKAKAVAPYVYSKHDSGWVDFLRLPHSIEAETGSFISKAYWSGINVQDCQLTSCGQPWSQKPIIEILFIGQIEFYDKNLESDSQTFGTVTPPAAK